MISDLIQDDGLVVSLRPEVESGNVEYKLRLDTKDELGISKTKTQLKWRLSEGKKMYGRYEAIYVFGIMDNGMFPSLSEKLTEKNIDDTINIFSKAATDINCKVISKDKYIFYKDKLICLVKVAMDIDSGERITETNVLLVGPTNAGKTSLLSQLTHDQEDNGQGYSRKLSLKHEHERRAGRTTDIKREFIGFKGDELVNYFTGLSCDMEDIYTMSDRYVTIDDLPGDAKYIRTMIYGILSSKHDIIIICIPADDVHTVLKSNAKQYSDVVTICRLYKKNPVLLLTKIDLITENEIIKAVDDVKIFFQDLGLFDLVYINSDTNKTCPIDIDKSNIISISNINALGFNTLTKYLSHYSKTVKINLLDECNKDILFITNEIFNIPSVGNVLYGYVKYGKIVIGDEINIFCGGNTIKRKVKSIHKKMIESTEICQGETGCIQFYNLTGKNIDKTSVVISDTMKKFIVSEVIYVPDEIIPPKKSYLMFNGSTIQTIDLYYEQNIVKYRATNKTKLFIYPNSVTVLKDEVHFTYVGTSTHSNINYDVDTDAVVES